MKRNRPLKTFTYDPEALTLVQKYAEQRGIGQSTAISELLLYVFKGEDCPTNPKVIERAISDIREELAGRGRA